MKFSKLAHVHFHLISQYTGHTHHIKWFAFCILPPLHFHSCSIYLYLLLVLVSKKKQFGWRKGENSMRTRLCIWFDISYTYTHVQSLSLPLTPVSFVPLFLIQNDFHFLSSFKQPQVHSCKWDMRHYKTDKLQRNGKPKNPKTRNF